MNLIELFGQAIPPAMIEKVGAASGLVPDVSQRVFQQASPVLGYGLADAGSTEQGAQKLLDMARDNQAEASLDRVDAIAASPQDRAAFLDKGSALLSKLFGGRVDAVMGALGQETRTSETGIRSMLGMLAPLALGALTRHARSENMDARGLSTFLGAQCSSLAGLLPAGLGKLLGTGGATVPRSREVWEPTVEREVSGSAPIRPPTSPSGRRSSGIGPLLALAAAIGLIGWFISSRHRAMEERRETAAATAARPYEPTPGMGTLAPTQGLDALASYENQPGKLVAPQRFTLDASFVTGSADLTPGSDASLEKLAGVLRAHPTMRIRVEGYTDAMGKAAGNQQLSLARAESAKSTLVAQGIVPARVETVGMGNANPVAPNMTTEGREQNRRVDVLLLEK